MAISDLSAARRLVLAGGFALAIAAGPAVAAFTAPVAMPGVLADDCSGGEEPDTFTGDCVPHTVPNSPFTTTGANPDIPEIDGVPCTGADSGACIGLAEDAPQYQAPTSTVGSDPTVHGVE
jgi:hypothetical protein